MSVYRESATRYGDDRSVASGRTTGGTRVTRYVVKEDDSRSRFDERSRAGTRYDDRRTEIDVREEERDRGYSRATERDPHYHRETITIRRDESSPSRRESYWNRPAGEDVQDRELVIRASASRDNVASRAETRKESMTVSRVDDRREQRFSDYEVVSPQRDSYDERDREVQRYIRNTEYYAPPAPQQQPQTIIIRQEPIIIRETVRDRPREEEYQIVKKSDVEEERSVARRSEPRDEEYFYEKRVRERLPDDQERRLRRPVSPHDSVSQAGRRGYESDDSMVYVRKETREYSSRSSSPPRARSMAAGALVGVGAAELLRNHNHKQGKETSSGAGRVAKDVGAGVAGVVAAEAIRRYRSKSRHGSRSRSGSKDRVSRRSGRGRDRDRSRSRSSSKGAMEKFGGVGGIGLAAAAVAVGALVASRKKKENSQERRSRSRTRRSSRSRSRAGSRASSMASLENDSTATDDRNPSNRNKKTAAAGAVGAAAMALYERHRSKSRGRRHSESPNRLKQGVPIALAGLGAAGLAHQFEKRKAREEAQAIVAEEKGRSRSRTSRSRSRPRADSTYYDGPSQRSYSDPNLIQYGTEPLYGNNYGEGYYGRPGQETDYYANHNRDIVRAPTAPPAAASYGAGRTRSVSSSRSRSRSRGAAAVAGAAAAGVAASEYDQRRKDKKNRRRREYSRSHVILTTNEFTRIESKVPRPQFHTSCR